MLQLQNFLLIGERTAHTTLWASHEGLRVGAPLEEYHEPGRCLLNYGLFENCKAFVKDREVRWLHLRFPSEMWSFSSWLSREEARPLFPQETPWGRADARERETSLIGHHVELLRRSLELASIARKQGGQASREAAGDSAIWSPPVNLEFSRRWGTSLCKLTTAPLVEISVGQLGAKRGVP